MPRKLPGSQSRSRARSTAGSSVPPHGHGGGALGVAREALDTVDRDLAEFQRDEAMVWRLGSIALLLLAAALGAAAALGVLVLLLRWWDGTRPPPDDHAVDPP